MSESFNNRNFLEENRYKYMYEVVFRTEENDYVVSTFIESNDKLSKVEAKELLEEQVATSGFGETVIIQKLRLKIDYDLESEVDAFLSNSMPDI